jgi:hypothetical protein
MKTIITLMLIVSMPVLAQTMEAKRKKTEMIERAQTLRLAAETAEELFENEQVTEACGHVSELFRGLPAYLTSIMSNMNIYDKKIKKMSKEALSLLSDFHAIDQRCKKGENFQFVDPKKGEKLMKTARKTLKRHINVIEDNSTSYNNAYYYNYEFHDPY